MRDLATGDLAIRDRAMGDSVNFPNRKVRP